MQREAFLTSGGAAAAQLQLIVLLGMQQHSWRCRSRGSSTTQGPDAHVGAPSSAPRAAHCIAQNIKRTGTDGLAPPTTPSSVPTPLLPVGR